MSKNKIKIIFFSICLVVACTLVALFLITKDAQPSAGSYNATYASLDTCLNNGDKFLAVKQHKIDSLKLMLSGKSLDDNRRWILSKALYDEYMPTVNDSAIAYANRCASIARQMGDNERLTESEMALAYQNALSGYYFEALAIFSQIKPEDVPTKQLSRYYYIGFKLYNDMANDATSNEKAYRQRSGVFKKQMIGIKDSNNLCKYELLTEDAINSRKLKEALTLSDKWQKMVKPYSHDYAIMAFFRSEVYRFMNDETQRKYWLTQSAIADTKCAVMDMASLWTLAELIYKDGDLDRAYRYMIHSWSCIETFSVHKRGAQASKVLALVNKNYQAKMQKANARIATMAILLLVLLSAVCIALILAISSRKKLAVAKDSLVYSNNRLKEAMLSLTANNKQLDESNRVKLGYITAFFSICSTYIEKLDNYRQKLGRKLKARQFKDMETMLNDKSNIEEEHQKLLETFDDIFFNLYPNFVEEFNSLLQPEFRLKAPYGQKDKTILRIFALIKLGITESSRIAEMLGYTPNTIYNYRTRAKNMSAVPRDEFEERLKVVAISQNYK